MHDVVIAGVIASSGSDAAARQLAEVFGTDTSLVEFLDSNAVNVRIFLDWFTNCLLYVGTSYARIYTDVLFSRSHKYSAQGVNLPLPSGMKIDTEASKGSTENRDAQRKGVTDMMNRKLREWLSYHETLVPNHFPVDEHEPKATMQWKHWADLAFAKKLCILGWPKNVTAPGPDWKKIASAAATALTAGYYANRRNPTGERVPEVQIVRWNAGTSECLSVLFRVSNMISDDLALATDDNELANVPVVVDTDGQVLRSVMDSKAYRTSLGAKRDAPSTSKAAPGRAKLTKRKDNAEIDGEDFTNAINDIQDDSDGEGRRPRATRPLPSRAQQPERTLKRKRMDDDAADTGEHETKRSHVNAPQTNTARTSHSNVSQAGSSTGGLVRGGPHPPSRNSAQGPGPAMTSRRPAVEGSHRQPPPPLPLVDDDDLPDGPAAAGFLDPQTGRYYKPKPAAEVRSSDLLVARRQGSTNRQYPWRYNPSTPNPLPFFATAPAPTAPTAAMSALRVAQLERREADRQRAIRRELGQNSEAGPSTQQHLRHNDTMDNGDGSTHRSRRERLVDDAGPFTDPRGDGGGIVASGSRRAVAGRYTTGDRRLLAVEEEEMDDMDYEDMDDDMEFGKGNVPRMQGAFGYD